MLNIAAACARLSGITLSPGERLDFNADIGPYNAENGYHVAPVLTDGKITLNYGGGTCQVSSRTAPTGRPTCPMAWTRRSAAAT